MKIKDNELFIKEFIYTNKETFSTYNPIKEEDITSGAYLDALFDSIDGTETTELSIPIYEGTVYAA